MNLVPIEHGGQRVLTTQQLAEFYGEPPVKLQQNFSNNRQRYVEGEHYFRIEHGQEGYSKFSSSPYATKPIYLWTEKGALYGGARSKNPGLTPEWTSKEVIPVSGRWRHPNRTTERVYNKRPRRHKPEPKILRRVEKNLDEYRWAARMILDLVARMEI
jgi:hypothetical protein